jgi:hypothetical protein
VATVDFEPIISPSIGMPTAHTVITGKDPAEIAHLAEELTRLIAREEALKVVAEFATSMELTPSKSPTATAKAKLDFGVPGYTCSACDGWAEGLVQYAYCPHCGVKFAPEQTY